LSRVAQAFDSLPASVFVSSSLKAGMLAGMLVLGGCGAGGFSLEQADVDRSIVTSSIPATPPPDDAGLAADQATIRNAVSSADVEALAGKDISWANSETGSRGTIMQLAENKTGGKLCRQFTATRESFDGVALFKGEACMVGYGAWRMQAFAVQ
jgi:surface antigen